jgi:uncharacterized coiled-coil protein SlyX
MKKILHLTALLSSALWMSCTTMSFLPREGTVSKFNLATVEYVQSVSQTQRETLAQEFSSRLVPMLDSLLAGDRETVQKLAKLISEQEQKLTTLSAKMDSTEANVMKVSSKMLRDLADMRSANTNMQLYIDQLKGNMDSLPLNILRELNTAIEQYIQANSPPEAPSEP